MIVNAVLFKCDRCPETSTQEDAKDFPDGWVLLHVTTLPQGSQYERHLCGECAHLLTSFLENR